MAINIKQELKLDQQLAMTPQLQQSIQMLLLTRAEMELKVQEALVENPLLEEFVEEPSSKENEVFNDDHSSEVEFSFEDIDKLFEGSENVRHIPSTPRTEEDMDSGSLQERMPSAETLISFLDEQLYVSPLNKHQRRIAQHIFGNLDSRGYLSEILLDELADECNEDSEFGFDTFELQPSIELETGDIHETIFRDNLDNSFHDVSVHEVQEVLDFVHSYFEPVGVAACNLQECLTIQIDKIQNSTNQNICALAKNIVCNSLSLLETKNYKKIAAINNSSDKDVISAVRLITSLEPIPARRFGSYSQHYITPDIYIDYFDGQFIPRINDEGIPKLRISSYYANIAKSKQCDPETRSYILEKTRGARFFIESIYERQNTIFKVTQSIIKYQKDFFEKGVEYLKPLILKDIADDIGVHESTVSRVTSNKYVDTPRGMFELKYFFNSSISSNDGDELGSLAVKAKIKEIIENENSQKPLSDSKIAETLANNGIEISRRTVAKYREALGFLSSSKRKRIL